MLYARKHMTMRYYRPTWAEINLEDLSHNFRQVKKLLSPSTKIMVTVKADAYGHGLIPVSKKLVSCQADFLGVASIDEGLALRKAGIKLPILVMGLALKEDLDPACLHGLSLTVCDKDFASFLNSRARILGKLVNVHIKVDTGMGRIGVTPLEAAGLVRDIRKLKNLRVEGLFTHFAIADKSREFTFYQLGLFDKLTVGLKKSGIHIPLIHAANSIGLIDYSKSHFNLVRPGLVIYGLHPKEDMKTKFNPVLSLKTRIVFIKSMPKGRGISYGHDYVTKRKTTIVTLPIGYGDGYPRNLSNRSPVLIGGERFKVSGRICMDQLMVDVGDLPVRTGDEAVLIGSQGKYSITAEELARLSGTIPYEIVCGLGSRIPRVYK